MDFTLMLSPQQNELQLAENRDAILAAGHIAFTLYGLQLSGEEAAMIAAAGSNAQREEDLVEFGSGITPRLMHLFLPTGYLGTQCAKALAALTEAFYHIKGRLQSICEEADDFGCMLSDNAVLHYMYRLFISPACAGDIDIMTEQAEQIVCGTMQRLLRLRAKQRKAKQSVLAGDPEYRMLYADVLADEFAESDMERRFEDEYYDSMYSDAMEYAAYGTGDTEIPRGPYAEELAALLQKNPALLIPGRRQEAEWDSMAEEWEEQDAAAAKAAEAALHPDRKEP